MGGVDATTGRSRAIRLLLWPLRILRRLVAVIPMAVDGYFAHRLPQYAAGIAYRVLFSLAPLAIVLVSVFGLVLQDEELREDVIDSIVDWLPVSDQGSQDIEQAISALATPASALGLLSLLIFAWAATGMMAAIRNGLEAAMQVTRSRPAARNKLVDFALVAAAGALVLVAVGIGLALQVVERVGDDVSAWLGIDGGAFDVATGTAVPVGVSMIVVMLLYRFVPARRIRLRDAVAGAFVTALLFLAINALSALIFAKTTDWSVVYGSLAVALVFLYSVYLYASAILLGAEVAAAWSRPPGPPEPILVQVKRAVVGIFVHREPEQPPGEPGYQAPPPREGSGTPGGRTT
jgi:membrane protein